MPKLSWPSIRLTLLALTFVGTFGVWAKLSTAPKAESGTTQTVTANKLQETVPLPNWQQSNSTPLSPNEDSEFGRTYRYQQNGSQLDVELHYMISDGNVSRYLFVHSPVHTANANLKVKYEPNVGYYGLVTHENTAYLSACINPRGGSTVTEQQFTQTRYTHDLQPSRILPWMLGKESLIDYRCLWTLMSIPLKKNNTTSPSERAISEESAYKELEAAWFSWHQWWQAHFPPSST